RRRDVADERRVLVEPTAKGEALRERAARVPAALACQLPLEVGELRSLHGVLTRFVAEMRKSSSEATE
ncbi:MAG: MarR family transcriptional regulator, partial [Mesorhizobium sp.]